MLKKFVITVFIALLISLGLSIGSMHAQKYYEEETRILDDDLTFLTKKLDSILSYLADEKNKDKEFMDKISQILANQAQIKDELKIIKIRASRR
ncbi:MAG: hypothetical protein KJ838_01430 [Candidatus Omnitrophica bacterium]|nr:hypothetical protein [Candidatus Omnitrophota bacterium]